MLSFITKVTKLVFLPNQPAGTATSTDIVKKTAANKSGRMLHEKVSMDQPTGKSKKQHLLEKMKIIKRLKEQLVKCAPGIWPQCFRVFNERSSYFPELHPKNIFFNDYDLVFYASVENKLIFKENYVLQWGILQKKSATKTLPSCSD
jgi:hypothetical protein